MNKNYINRPIIPNSVFDNQDRFFPFFGIVPFIVGGVVGGALVSASRPRPIIGYPAYPQAPYGSGYSYSSYGHSPYPYY